MAGERDLRAGIALLGDMAVDRPAEAIEHPRIEPCLCRIDGIENEHHPLPPALGLTRHCRGKGRASRPVRRRKSPSGERVSSRKAERCHAKAAESKSVMNADRFR